MKIRLLSCLLLVVLLLVSCGGTPPAVTPPDGGGEVGDCTGAEHVDANDDDVCDVCHGNVSCVVDFYAINDLHGKFEDTSSQPGVDELSTYLENMKKTDDHTVFLSSGDMWQGSGESNFTKGNIVTDWMNAMGFVSMTLGNHEYDWGVEYIRQNAALAEFPFLALNIYDRATDQPVDYCEPSLIVERGGAKIGIIGAMGDCYSSILQSQVADVYFQTGDALSALIRRESQNLREAGADVVILSIHDGIDNYDETLSDGYVDLVFEGHTHSGYVKRDSYGVYHLQNGGDNKGLSHVEMKINVANDTCRIKQANFVTNSAYSNLQDHPIVDQLMAKYADAIAAGDVVLGKNDYRLSGDALADLVMELYLQVGLEKWGSEYPIVAAGGSLSTRSPYDLAAGDVRYSQLMMLLPFDNQITLASIQGRDLTRVLLENTDDRYHLAIIDDMPTIDPNETYYVIADTWTSTYSYSNMTIVDYYDPSVYARDLVAEYIQAGGMTSGDTEVHLTPIPDLLAIGNALDDNKTTSSVYYVEGVIEEISNSKYGNMTIRDSEGNTLIVYGVNDATGSVMYENLTYKPQVGDTVVLCGPIMKYVNSYGTKIELYQSMLISVK